ncbi:hypothetical protein BDV96DRAFT_614276 [Lophiotrema nucula]|uniref:Uncharacterized protein n=1 Tax=Lophiotrema nucula TaxID=690887 RepID=A0A6A5Z038_9PLEO|nr:hypothetical protein BDV96DRAFT_614276 [Lophiotrema nucula]
MIPDTLPPYRHISSTPVSTTEASSILETYLKNSERHAHLHPDALITPSGVNFSVNGGIAGGVVLHNLRRVAEGLRGVYLEREPTPEPEDELQSSPPVFSNGKPSSRKRPQQNGENGEDWQNMSEYERDEAGVEVGEIGPRSTFVAAGKEAEADAQIEVHDNAGHVLGVNGIGTNGLKRSAEDQDRRIDKEARKRAKKERDQQHKKEKEKKKARKEA